ncbi:MAG: hypothetical protein CMM50_15905 [Rhodospirillaceae bacterium]|nr:hypothetical protein [Rhodospirillaceae bacterium]
MTMMGGFFALLPVAEPVQAGERTRLWDESRDFAYCARMALESAMHVSYPVEWVDRMAVETCFDKGRAEGLDEPAMRQIMAEALSKFIKPPVYNDYDPRTFGQ